MSDFGDYSTYQQDLHEASCLANETGERKANSWLCVSKKDPKGNFFCVFGASHADALSYHPEELNEWTTATKVDGKWECHKWSDTLDKESARNLLAQFTKVVVG